MQAQAFTKYSFYFIHSSHFRLRWKKEINHEQKNILALCRQEVLSFREHQTYLEGLLKHKLLGPICRISDSVSVGWGLRICILKKSLGDADAASPGTTL